MSRNITSARARAVDLRPLKRAVLALLVGFAVLFAAQMARAGPQSRLHACGGCDPYGH